MLRDKIKDLAFDLSTIKWIGYDKGWQLACDRLKKELLLILEDETKDMRTTAAYEDDKVLVWEEEGDMKTKRHFSHFTRSGEIACFAGGTTSWTTHQYNFHPIEYWSYWEFVEESETNEI